MKNTILIFFLFLTSFSYSQRQDSIVIGQQFGLDAAGRVIPLGVTGTSAFTSTSLSPNATWSSGWLSRGQFISAQTILYSDNASGSYTIEYSEDNGQTLSMPTITVPYTPSQGTRVGAFSINASFVRFTYTNGSIVQNKFKFEIRFQTTAAQASYETLNAAGADTRLAQWSKTRIETKDSDTGTYKPIYRTGNSLNVHVDNQSVSTPTVDSNQTRKNVNATITNPVTSVSINNFPSTQSVSGTVNANVSFPSNQAVTVSNPVNSVAVTNFPSTQTITGTVNANVTFPSNQNTTVTNFPDSNQYRRNVIATISNPTTSVSVNNFPSFPDSSSTRKSVLATITNPTTSISVTNNDYSKDSSLHNGFAKTQITNFPTNQAVTVSNPVNSLSVNNFPATQQVGGTVTANVAFPANQTVTVSNFPSTQAVSGNVSVSNFPATQNVSVTSQVPLPTGTNTIGNVNINGTVPISGTVTSTTDSTKTRLVHNVNVIGTVPVSGTFFQSTQPVSGTVAISNPPVVSANDSSKYRKVISIDNYPAVQPVSGNINATIQGTPTVNANVTFPTTQNVNVTGFDSTKTRLNQTTTVTNSFNLESTQQSILTGINGVNTDQGAPTDAAATTGTGTYGEIALLKGMLNALVNGVSTTTTPFTPYFFPYLTTSAVQTLKASSGSIGSVQISNPTSTDLYIQFFNTTGAVTLGTTVPTISLPIDATQGNINFNNAAGIFFSTGIKYAITTTPNGNGAPASTIYATIAYK